MSRTARRPRRARTLRRQQYRTQLRDPRWQKRRLEVLQRDGWRCRQCGARDKELHVHHTVYRGAPWEAPGWALLTLCVDCHRRQPRH